jgi:ketosteroid isomerase-like protein
MAAVALMVVGSIASAQSPADSLSASRAVETFHASLAKGDSAAALALLASDVVVLESGDVERLADYRSHHLGADISFARAVPSKRALTSLRVEGNVAWVASTSVTQGQFNGRAINSVGAELMVLTRADTAAPWRIRAIHWSSRRKQP